jgi:hypothetical protein
MMIAPAMCCGDCSPELEKPENAASLAAKRVMDHGSIPLVAEPAFRLTRTLASPGAHSSRPSPLLRPPLNSLPARL